MSGGHWDYQSWKLEEEAEKWAKLMKAIGQSEHIVDWAICGDTSEETAGKQLYELWLKTFEEVFGNGD